MVDVKSTTLFGTHTGEGTVWVFCFVLLNEKCCIGIGQNFHYAEFFYRNFLCKSTQVLSFRNPSDYLWSSQCTIISGAFFFCASQEVTSFLSGYYVCVLLRKVDNSDQNRETNRRFWQLTCVYLVFLFRNVFLYQCQYVLILFAYPPAICTLLMVVCCLNTGLTHARVGQGEYFSRCQGIMWTLGMMSEQDVPNIQKRVPNTCSRCVITFSRVPLKSVSLFSLLCYSLCDLLRISESGLFSFMRVLMYYYFLSLIQDLLCILHHQTRIFV